MPSNKNRKGRRKSGPNFVQLFHFMLDSKAWHELSFAARSAYVEIAHLYNGQNNGSLGMSSRRLAEILPCNKNTAARCLTELEDAGFIEAVKVGRFTRTGTRQASEYRLTAHRCDLSGHPPSRAFGPGVKWEGKSVPKIRTVRYEKLGQCDRENTPSVPKNGTENANQPAHSVPKNGTHIHLHHVGGSEAEAAESNRAWPETGYTMSGREIEALCRATGRQLKDFAHRIGLKGAAIRRLRAAKQVELQEDGFAVAAIDQMRAEAAGGG